MPRVCASYLARRCCRRWLGGIDGYVRLDLSTALDTRRAYRDLIGTAGGGKQAYRWTIDPI